MNQILFIVVLALSWPLESHGECEFPTNMRGEWFQKSYHESIIITNTSLSKHGRCVERRQDKFLLHNARDNTYSFVVITQKHPNVMQYKETPAPLRGNWTLDQAYAELTGDTPLYSVFRIDGDPVPCPFRETFHFSYNRGSGNCSNPPSISDSCTDKSRVLFNFKACYDTHSESRKETLTCVGTWKEGSHHYLVGKMDYSTAHTNEDRFRCFIYEERRSPYGQVDGYNVAISGDATCDGVQSPNEGSTLLYLSRSTRARTPFPSWMYQESHHWRTLNNEKSFEVSRENTSLVIQTESRIEQRWMSEEVSIIGENHVRVVVHAIEGCESGYICLYVYRRAPNVLELQMGQRTSSSGEACLQSYFDPGDLDYTTLLAEPVAAVIEAPLEGKFVLSHPSGALFTEMLTLNPNNAAAGERKQSPATQQPYAKPVACQGQMTLLSACESNVSRFEMQSLCTVLENGTVSVVQKSVQQVTSVQAKWDLADERGTTTYMVVALRQGDRDTERSCFAITEDRKNVFYLGTSTCSRRSATASNKFDLYKESPCPPPGASEATRTSHFPPYILIVISVVTLLISPVASKS